MLRKLLLSLLLFIIFAGVGFYVYLSQTYPNTSPLLTGMYYIERVMNPRPTLNKRIMGFLPYWRTDDINNIKPHLLSEISYFSITAQPDGHLAKDVNGETDPGWNAWQGQEVKDFITKTHIAGADFTVTIAALNNDLITSILDNPQAQIILVSEIASLVKEYKLDGVIIDFEYFGEPDPVYKQAFTKFSQQLAAKLDNETPNAKLSLTIMPRAARDPDIYEYESLVKVYDRFIGMSYDYYGQSSDIAGPVAPMRGFKDNTYFFDVETTYEDYLNVIPKEKIIMGVPHYGWDRAVEDGRTINSLTFPSDNDDSYTAVISYARAREDQIIQPKQCSWDSVAQETWCWYNKGGIDHQVWIADNKSVGIRYDYANKQNLGGIGIWVLGYDKNYPDLWEMIEKKFSGKK